ncbi:hypothetical protein [Vogesella indigofera]|nr:hypothetical protein [Vogesella indigofera]MDC7706573.1 hypothetical protein [Vogesella indigofera]
MNNKAGIIPALLFSITGANPACQAKATERNRPPRPATALPANA